MEIGGSGARDWNSVVVAAGVRARVLMIGIGIVWSGAEIPLLHR